MNLFFKKVKPEDPEIGDSWFDRDTNELCTYDGVSVHRVILRSEDVFKIKQLSEENIKETWINRLVREGVSKEDAEIMYMLSMDK